MCVCCWPCGQEAACISGCGTVHVYANNCILYLPFSTKLGEMRFWGGDELAVNLLCSSETNAREDEGNT